MGFNLSYVAMKAAADDLADAFDLQISRTVGDLEALDAENLPEPDRWIARLEKTGWSVLMMEDEGLTKRQLKLLSSISAKAPLLHVMITDIAASYFVEYYADGDFIWNVGEIGTSDEEWPFFFEGDPPPTARHAIQRLETWKNGDRTNDDEEALVDAMSDLPHVLSLEICGFRCDTVLAPEDVGGFHIVTARPRQGIIARLFGAK